MKVFCPNPPSMGTRLCANYPSRLRCDDCPIRPGSIEAIDALIAIIRVVAPLAVAARTKCACGRAVPWERMGWATPICYQHYGNEEDGSDPMDEKRRARLERDAESLCGLTAPDGWSR